MEDEKSLKASALIRKFADTVQHQVDDLLADRVVTASVVVGCVLLSGDELLGMEELAVGTSAHLINDSRLQIDEDGTGDMLARACLRNQI